jgi:MFS family permease
LTSELNVRPETPFSAESRWGVFSHSAFVVILAATSLSNIGFAMFDTGSGWLMTSLNPSPRMVSAVQIATTLPLFLLTLPAGVLTDVVDPRRLLIVAQAGVAAVSFAFAATVSVGLASPTALLATSFLLGVGGGLTAPAWLLILPMLVTRTELDSAIAVDSASYNLARAVGPVIAGFAIARQGVDVPFWCCWVGNLAFVAALIWWRAPRRARETLPAERLITAMMTGIRYVRYSREMDATLIRAVAFFPFASAYLALLPLVARTQMRGGPEVYGALMAAIGAGSIAASFALKWLKARLGPDQLAALGTIGTMLALLMFAAARELPLALLGSLIAGASSILMLTHFTCLRRWLCRSGFAVGAWRFSFWSSSGP